MGSFDDYRREKTATAQDVADTIHDTVTIEDALLLYRPDLEPRRKRCPCPIHNGKDYNFSFNDRGYRCFVCGESGDVISLVQHIFDLRSRVDAMQKICSDFDVGVYFRAPISAKVSAMVNEARLERERKKREQEEWEKRYHEKLDQWIELDKIVMRTPWDTTENIRIACKAKQDRARVGYELDEIMSQKPR